ncbi:unnamed protein product [Cylindrotheca closterium]|uniref:Disease resistance R13L4/SHOC-2-like LRR domain-containing protein n=1 Tax=Cylindrotheca closterium TaxID=2856 RepID=A0AAD2CHG2_9STRA|nr:unnamed protein product [Cylindrotheca closterium]
MTQLDHETPFDAVAVDPASRPNLDDQLSTETDHWETNKNKCCYLFHHQEGSNHWKKAAAVAAILLVTVLGIAYAKAFSLTSNNSDDSSLSRMEYRAKMESMAEMISDPLTLLDPFSAQSRALDWLVDTDTLSIDIDYDHSSDNNNNNNNNNFKQRYALMVFFFATNGNGWTMVETWDELTGTSECSFSGIDCDSKMRVIALSMSARRLSGTIPEEVGVLSYLETLILGRNDLQGSIPSSIFTGCQRLVRFDVGFNRLSSTLSTEIGTLVNLQVLLVSSTSISGPLPESLKNLSQLLSVGFVRTNLEGPIFDFVQRWPNIRALLLDGSNVNLTIPTEIGKLTNMQSLRLHALGTHGGSIPSEIGNLEKLEHLVIEGTTYTGSIPSQIGKLSNLTYIRISGGLITGTLPTEIASLTSLERLDLMDNNLDGDISADIGNLEQLTEFSIAGNNFEGRLPGTFCSVQAIFYDCTLTCDCCACTCFACT